VKKEVQEDDTDDWGTKKYEGLFEMKASRRRGATSNLEKRQLKRGDLQKDRRF